MELRRAIDIASIPAQLALEFAHNILKHLVEADQIMFGGAVQFPVTPELPRDSETSNNQ